MPHALRPLNWVDWFVLVMLVWGAAAGLRRGLLPALAAAASVVLALMLAVHFAPAASAAAETRWNAGPALALFLQRTLLLPDGSGQIPYSPPAIQIYVQQLRAQPATAAYAASLQSLLSSAGPPPPPATLGSYLAALLARRLLDIAAFVAVFAAARTVLGLALRLSAARGRPVRRPAAASALGGALAAALARVLDAAIALALLSALGALPMMAGTAGALRRSRWAAPLLAALRHLLPAADPWIQAWLSWV